MKREPQDVRHASSTVVQASSRFVAIWLATTEIVLAASFETGRRLVHRVAVRTRLAGRAAVTRELARHEPSPPMARTRTAAVALAVATLAMVPFAITRRASPPGWCQPSRP